MSPVSAKKCEHFFPCSYFFLNFPSQLLQFKSREQIPPPFKVVEGWVILYNPVLRLSMKVLNTDVISVISAGNPWKVLNTTSKWNTTACDCPVSSVSSPRQINRVWETTWRSSIRGKLQPVTICSATRKIKRYIISLTSISSLCGKPQKKGRAIKTGVGG